MSRIDDERTRVVTETVRMQISDGIEAICDVAGPPDGPTVVLLHGGGQTRDSWTRTRDLLVADGGFRVVAPDLRGHGDSDRAPAGIYQLSDFAEDLVELAAALGSPVAAVGASLGGAAALMAAARHPELFWAIVLVDIAAKIEIPGIERIVGFMKAHPDGFASLEDAADAVAEHLPHREFGVKLKRSFARNLRHGSDGRYRWHWDPAMFEGRYGLTLEDADQMQEQMRQAAAQVRLPTLLIRGGRSDVLSHEGVDEFRNLVPHAEFAEIQRATHMVVGDDNDPFTAAVADFLDRHARRDDRDPM